MYWLRRFTILLVCVVVFSFAAWTLPRVLDPTSKTPEERAQDRRWVNSSPYWLDRQACRWISLCGLHHLRKDPAALSGFDWHDDDRIGGELRKRADWEQGAPREDKKRNHHQRRRILREIPDYVTRYAPLVHLYSGEQFWPSDIKEHVEHMSVYVDGEPVNATQGGWNLHNLHELNKLAGEVMLRSNDDVESRPDWLHSHHNLPNPFDDDGPGSGQIPHTGAGSVDKEPTTWYDVAKDRPLNRISDPRGRSHGKHSEHATMTRLRLQSRGHKPDADGYSNAPAVLVVVDKGHGIVDAFWFFFYSYNLGQTVLGTRFGNHVGDWEHCMIRFENGLPRGIFFSEHEGGQAYAYDAVEKSSTGRPIIYSAIGSHAMYALPGNHPYILPFHVLKDVTDKGPIWDPSLNNYAYHYDYDPAAGDVDDPKELERLRLEEGESPYGLAPASKNPHAPTSWFYFGGRWGDEVYSLADPRQWRLFGQYHYVTGPDGPLFKNLHRAKLCQRKKCKILYKLDPNAAWY
jgi:hypothetical protein